MTPDDFRKQALQIPGAVEQSHGSHPDFRLGGKVFASLGAPDEEWGMVKLTPEEQATFTEQAPAMFRPCNGVWGKRGYTNVCLEVADKSVLRSALAAASKNVTAGATGRKKSK